MAKLKAELVHEHHQREGASLRDRLFANVDTLARLGSATAPLSNWLANLPGSDRVTERVGIAPERDLPTFRRRTFRDWFADHDPPGDADRRAVLFPDTYTNYVHPETGAAAVRVLEHAGVRVELAPVTDSGRPAHSKGFLDDARETAREAVTALEPYVETGYDVVVAEPSDAVMLQSDYHDLLGDDADPVAANTYGVMEYLNVHGSPVPPADPESLAYHGHCHQKATRKDSHAAAVLGRAGHEVTRVDSTCCGMAGSFGYEAEHYSLSQSIKAILDGQLDASDGDTVVAPGTSCRTQLGDRDPVHPVEKLADGL